MELIQTNVWLSEPNHERPTLQDVLWNQLTQPVLGLLKSQLGVEFKAFAAECERLGLLQNNFIQLVTKAPRAMREPNTICSFCASAVVSAANHFGGAGDLGRAERLASWALQIEPQHVPAMNSLLAVAMYRNDQSAQRRLRAAIDSTIAELRALPEQQLTAFQLGVIRGVVS